MTTLIITGSPGAGVRLAAIAIALRHAGSGARTLLLSVGSPAALGSVLGMAIGTTPAAIAPQLDALALDAGAELTRSWAEAQPQLPSQLAGIAGDELPLLPGMGALFGLARLRELAPQYEHVVLDAGPHDDLIQLLNLPDAMRWAVRLAIGLDRNPGKSSASVARALLPTTFLPIETLDRVQQARVEADRVRAELLAGAHAFFVLRPDAAALAEARLALPALQLHGLAVRALVAGPLLPIEAGALGAAQGQLVTDARAIWPQLPLLRLPALLEANDLDGLRAAAGDWNVAPPEDPPPLAESSNGEPALVIDIPGLPQGALQLTLSGDELIVRVGPYRRHVLLPEPLRGITAIRAMREGTRLVVRRR
jgi:arsenite/tail-anchored protein-transporting ATPase